MYGRQGSKRAVETFLVGSGNQALSNTANSGNHLVNQSTGAVRLADGQLGIVDASGYGSNTYMDLIEVATPTAAESPVIQLVQGTSASASPATATATYPLWVRPFEASQPINGNNYVVATKQAPAQSTTSTWVIGAANGATGEIVSNSNTNYQLSIAYRGRTMDEWYSNEAAASFSPSFVTPDYDALSISTAALKRDHLLQNLAWVINRNSRAIAVNRAQFKGNDPVVALLIDSTGTTGVEIGQGTPIAAGDTIPVFDVDINGSTVTRNLILNADQAASIKNAAISAFGDVIANVTWSIVKGDISTAGTATNGVADILMLIALDREEAFKDYIPQKKIRLDVGLTSGFDYATVAHAEHEEAFEGEGVGAQLAKWYDATHGQRKYNLQQTMDPIVNFPNPVDTADSYYVYVIEHADINQIDTSNTSGSPMREIILVPDEGSTTVSELDTALTSWLASINQSLVTV